MAGVDMAETANAVKTSTASALARGPVRCGAGGEGTRRGPRARLHTMNRGPGPEKTALFVGVDPDTAVGLDTTAGRDVTAELDRAPGLRLPLVSTLSRGSTRSPPSTSAPEPSRQ